MQDIACTGCTKDVAAAANMEMSLRVGMGYGMVWEQEKKHSHKKDDWIADVFTCMERANTK